MPGSLLNLNHRKISRHDSARSDISTYSNDSKKKVSFNKAVRVKKYTRSEDGDKHSDGKNFWFKVYKDIDPDIWEEYSGDDNKYYSDEKLKTIDESSAVNHVTDESEKKNNIQDIIDKFNEQSLNREEEGASSNDTLTKYKRNSILNGMKAFFNSSSLKGKKKNGGSVKERNLENLFRNESYDNLLANDSNKRNDLKISRISEEWSPEKYEGNLRKVKEHDFDRKSNSVVDIKKWESGDQLIFDTRQYDKNIDKTDKGELTKTVEERDQVWQNVTRTITYAESSPKIIKKVKENNKSNERISDFKKKDVHLLTNVNRRDRGVQCNNIPTTVSEPAIKNSDKYKVIRSKNGIVSAYSNVPLLDKDKTKVNRTRNSLNNLCRTNVCTKDHNQTSNRNVENKLKTESSVVRKYKQDRTTKGSSRESSPCYKSDISDYRRGYSTPRNSRRGNKNRSRPKETAASINNIKITVNGEDIENQSLRGGLALAHNNRQRARNLSTSPLRSGSDTESTHEHKTVFLYIPGISHQQRPADDDEESGVTVMRSPSIKGKRPAKYHYYGNRSKPKDFDYINELDNRRLPSN